MTYSWNLLYHTVSMTFEIKELAIHDSILTGCSGLLFEAIAEENVRNWIRSSQAIAACRFRSRTDELKLFGVKPACDSVFFSSTWRQAFLHISPFRHHIPRGSAWITLRASLAGPTGFSRQRSFPSYWHTENAHDTGASLICGACVHVCVCLRAYTYTYTYTYTHTVTNK